MMIISFGCKTENRNINDRGMDMSRITLAANAKINLFLEVGARRADGYHDVVSVMQSVSLADRVTVTAGSDTANGISLRCGDLPTDSQNIAYRAADLFYSECGLPPRADIVIDKHIPVAAGLAGGSADGAAVLFALNTLEGEPFGRNALRLMAARLGADLPFCLFGGTQLAGGIGEELTPLPPMPDCTILIIKRREGVSTPAAFAELDRVRAERGEGHTPRAVNAMTAALRGGDIGAVGRELYNAFADLPYARRLGTADISDVCRMRGGAARLSGTGPSVFAVFTAEVEAAVAADDVRGIFCDAEVFYCRPTREGISVLK